ncbi:MAG: RICIN domain-containing protein [Nannocystaceae bacterium]
MRTLLTLSLSAGALLALPAAAHAASCWEVTGWSSTDVVGAVASLAPAPCTVIPITDGWIEVVDYHAPANDTIWVRVDLGDPRVDDWTFTPRLFFNGLDPQGVPILETGIIYCTGCENELPVLAWPPLQGTPTAGKQVRLRHDTSDNCLYGSSVDGAPIHNAECTDDPSMTFVLEKAGGGAYRLRNASTGKCLYALNQSGQTLRSWGCWSDPNMAFTLTPSGGGYRLHHVNTNQCVYGNPSDGGEAHHWVCWNDPEMVYWVDLLQ